MKTVNAFIDTKLASDRPTLIGVCGLAGAGKTSLCKAILKKHPNLAHHFVCDQFSKYSFREREARIAKAIEGEVSPETEENPLHWYAWDEIGNALEDLRAKRSFTYRHGWNRQTGELDSEYAVMLPPDRPALVLCDGIFLLHSPVRDWLDGVIFVDTPLDVTFDRGRKRARDATRRKYMERLGRAYSVPYFAQYASKADLICTLEAISMP